MKKYWLRIICFILLFTLLFTCVNQVMATHTGGLADIRKLKPNSIDVLFVGNSHNFKSFQPTIINDLLPINSYSIGISSENTIFTYYELLQVLKYQHPKIIVFETFAVFTKLNTDRGYIFTFLDSIGWNRSKMAIILKYLFPDNLAPVFPALRLRLDWNKPYEIIDSIKDYWKNLHSISQYLGANIAQGVISEEKYQSEYIDLNNRDLYPENMEYLKKIVAICKEKNIQLVFTTSPVIQKNKGAYDYSDPFKLNDYAKSENIPVIYLDNSQLTQLHYLDKGHVNSLGSLLLTVQMADALSGYLNLPVDVQKEKEYKEFAFDGFSINKKNGKTIIAVKPHSPDSPLLYSWKLTNDQGEIIEKKGWVTDPTFTFTLPNSKPYHVQLQILNPNNKFSVRLQFDFNTSE